MKVLGCYKNGNTNVVICNDGTKIRQTKDDIWLPEYPESIDLKITNKCSHGCAYCHENSTKYGKHADLLNMEFLRHLHPYTELAIGGGNPLEHPYLDCFLQMMANQKVICNMTLHQEDFLNNIIELINWEQLGWLHGIGVSYQYYSEALVEELHTLDNTVLHVIAGMISLEELQRLYDQDLKILILGYKTFRRGVDNFEKNESEILKNIRELKGNIGEIMKHFKVVSFDNLAIRQLEVSNALSKDQWDEFYMGDDGQFTMYIDAVEEMFSMNSTQTKRHLLLDRIEDMFEVVRNNEKEMDQVA